LCASSARRSDERHFGFIESDNGRPDILCGEAAFRQNDTAPQLGERYTFMLDMDCHGRPRATDIRYEGAEAAAERVFNPPRHEPVRP
jgi:cold shock CspA family protein